MNYQIGCINNRKLWYLYNSKLLLEEDHNAGNWQDCWSHNSSENISLKIARYILLVVKMNSTIKLKILCSNI